MSQAVAVTIIIVQNMLMAIRDIVTGIIMQAVAITITAARSQAEVALLIQILPNRRI